MAVREGSALCHVSSDHQEARQAISRLVTVQKLTHPHYQFKIFRNKGVGLVLFWSFSALLAFHLMTRGPHNRTVLSLRDKKSPSPLLVFTMCMLLYPILGWLGDVKCGRYRVIRWGFWTIWVMSILFCLISAILVYFYPLTLSGHSREKLKHFLYIPIGLGLGGIISNILQFGTDQLVDASSSEITSFLRWLAWLWFFSDVLVDVSQSCLCYQDESIGYLIFPAVITMTIASDFILSHWLVKEPPSSNPLVLILQVLRYAVKNKYPRQRSAFTYWEDKPYSRIDLAKDKYGGPFTTEQVEDVKTFFRIISVVLAATFFVSIFLSAYSNTYKRVMQHLADDHYTALCGPHSFVANCFQRASIAYAGNLVLLVAVPLSEFFFYPFFKYIRVSILQKASVGMTVLVLSLAACTAIEFLANHQGQQEKNKTCPLDGKVTIKPSLPLDYKWMALPYILDSIGQFLLFTSIGEFLCAQSPYSMKGFLFGVTFGFTGIFTILGYGIMHPVARAAKKKLSGGYGCMSWYLLMCLGFLLAILVMFFLAFKCYKKRMRNDSEHNEQIFAVNYYSQCQDSTE